MLPSTMGLFQARLRCPLQDVLLSLAVLHLRGHQWMPGCCAHDFVGLPALVTGAQDWGSAHETHIQGSRQKGIPHLYDSSNALNNTISLGLVFASRGGKQRFFLISSVLQLIQVPKWLVAQVAICYCALVCVFHLLTNHGDTYKTPVV